MVAYFLYIAYDMVKDVFSSAVLLLSFPSVRVHVVCFSVKLTWPGSSSLSGGHIWNYIS